MKNIIMHTSCIYTLILCLSPAFAEIYQWTDSNGSVHFSDNTTHVPKDKKSVIRHETNNNNPPPQQPSPRVAPQNFESRKESLVVDRVPPVSARTDTFMIENCISVILDLWREGSFAQIYERLANRGSREQFLDKMGVNTYKSPYVNSQPGIQTRRPACCWQKMDNFKVLSTNGNEAIVSVKIGIESTFFVEDERMGSGERESTSISYIIREFKFIHDGDSWKMELSDFLNLYLGR